MSITKTNFIRKYQQHEVNITAEIYFRLRSAGLECELEYRTPVGVIDLLVWEEKDRLIKAVVEVKRDKDSYTINSGQRARHKKLPLPMIVCRGLDEVPQTVAAIKQSNASIHVNTIFAIDRIVNVRRKRLRPEWDEDLIIRE